jgi:flagellum-specific peptidoglycan hydrolase FlgJ
MDQAGSSDHFIMRTHRPIATRLVLAALLLGILGQLTLVLEARIEQRTTAAAAAAAPPRAAARVHRYGVRALASGRRLLDNDAELGEQALLRIVRLSKDPQIRQASAVLLVDHAAQDWPSDRRGQFIRSVAVSAIRTGRAHRIPPSITIAQAIHESGWGRSALARRHHNLFGIKATTGQSGANFPTLEYTATGVRVEPARFRSYLSRDESLVEHAHLLAESPRYAPARAHAQNWRAYLSALAPVYATDPRYPRKITQIIERYDLHRWDSVVGPEPVSERPS